MKKAAVPILVAVILLTVAVVTEAQQGFPDSGFSDVLRYYTAQANAGTYEEGSFIAYWVRRLVPVWDTLPVRQQQFYHSIFAHYDGVLKCRSTRTCTEKEMNDILRYSLDPTQEPGVFEANMRRLKEHLSRQKANIPRGAQ